MSTQVVQRMQCQLKVSIQQNYKYNEILGTHVHVHSPQNPGF